MKQWLYWEDVQGTPIQIGDLRLTPYSQVVGVRWPWGGWVWQRPTAVLLEQGEMVRYEPIVDVTRLITVALVGLMILVTLFTHLRSKQ